MAWFVIFFDSDKGINEKDIEVFLYEQIMHNKFFTTLDEKLKISINDNNELEISINDNNKYKLDLIKQLKYIKINSINNLKDYKDKVIDYKTINDNTIDYTYSKLLLKCLVIDSFQYKKRECQYLIFNGIFDNILNNILERRSFLLSGIRLSYNHKDKKSNIVTENQCFYLKIDIPFHIAKLHKTFLSSLNNDFYLLSTIIFISYVIIITIICILYKNKQIQSLINKLQYIFIRYEEF